MRLALLTNDYPPQPGGIQQYLGNLVDHWPDDVRVLAPHDAPATATNRGEAVVRRFRPNPGPPRNFLWPTSDVADWVEHQLYSFGPDVVLFGAPHPLTGLISRVRRALGVPVGVLAHGAEVTIPAAVPGLRQWLARVLRRADVLFAVSRYTATRVESIAGVSCRFVGAGVDLGAFHPDEGASARVADPLVVGCISRFVPRKGQQLLIHAAHRLQREGVASRVVLVGKGRQEPMLRRLSSRLGVPVEFAIDVPWQRLPEIYRSFDVFCMPCRSRWGGLEVEGLGLVFLEAAASGLPVLAGPSGGAPETLLPGITGYVVENVDDIVQAVRTLDADRELCRRMGRDGRAFVEKEYSWRRVVERFRDGFAARGAARPDLDR